MFTNLDTANDNAPAPQNQIQGGGTSAAAERADTMGYNNLRPSASGGLIHTSTYSPVKSGVKIERPHVPSISRTKGNLASHQKTKLKPPNIFALVSLFAVWLMGVFLLARFSGGISNRPLVGENLALASGAFGFLSLYLSRVARLREAKIIYSLAISSACIALAWCVWFYAGASLSTLSIDYICVGLAAGMLLIATLWRSAFFLNLSLLTALAWSVFAFITAEVSPLAWLFPALWSLQMFKALGFGVRRSVLLSLITGLVWIGAHVIMLKPFG